jgi:hypothetical protein
MSIKLPGIKVPVLDRAEELIDPVFIFPTGEI